MRCIRQNVSLLERGQHRWTVERLVEAAGILGLPPGQILDEALKERSRGGAPEPVAAPHLPGDDGQA
jgi:hypothetical protein